MRSGAVDVLVVDSVAALTPRAEIEGEMGEVQPGLQARLMSQALRKLTGSISLQYARDLHQPDPHEDRRDVWQSGDDDGRQRAEVLRLRAPRHPPHRAIKERDETVGNQTRVKVVKNKVAPPFKQVEFDIMYGEGISKVGELIDLGVKAGRRREVGSVVFLRQPAPRPGPRERQGFPAAEPRGRRAHRAGDSRKCRPHRRENSRRPRR